jgi:hypothetical protein
MKGSFAGAAFSQKVMEKYKGGFSLCSKQMFKRNSKYPPNCETDMSNRNESWL